MHHEQRERQTGGHQELDVGGMREEERAEGEQHGRCGRGPAVARQAPREQPHRDDRGRKSEQDDDVVRGLRIAREPPGGKADRPRRRGWPRRTPACCWCGWKMFASKRSAGSVSSACATQATFQTDTRASPLLAVRPSRFRPVTSGQVMTTEAAMRERAQDDGPPRACADGVVCDAPCRMPLIQPQKTGEATPHRAPRNPP